MSPLGMLIEDTVSQRPHSPLRMQRVRNGTLEAKDRDADRLHVSKTLLFSGFGVDRQPHTIQVALLLFTLQYQVVHESASLVIDALHLLQRSKSVIADAPRAPCAHPPLALGNDVGKFLRRLQRRRIDLTQRLRRLPHRRLEVHRLAGQTPDQHCHLVIERKRLDLFEPHHTIVPQKIQEPRITAHFPRGPGASLRG